MNKTLIRRLLALVMAAAVAMVYMPAAAPAFALTGEDGTVVSQEDGQGTTDGQENSGTDVTTDSQNTEQETVTTDKGEGGDGTENGSEGAAVTEPEEETTEGSSEFGLTDEEMENLRGIDSSDPSEEPGVKISVGKSKVTVHVNRVGTAGTAFVYRCDADEYYKTDNMHGMSASLNYDGDIVGIYDCGTTQDFEFNRYQKAGIDNLYCKYYIIKDNEILAGPFYATEIYSSRSIESFPQASIKGLCWDGDDSLDFCKEMGASNTVINYDIGSLIYRNEDENGNPVDNSNKNVIEFESNGETFYFDQQYVTSQDGLISAFSRNGINVTLVVIGWKDSAQGKNYPSSLLYCKDNRQTVGFNTSNERGRKYWIAAMEFLGKRYSQSASRGLVDHYIIGNEIDYTYDWCKLQTGQGKVDFNIFMEEYARGFRLANLAVKKYNSAAQVDISLTHGWAVNPYEGYRCAYKDSDRYDPNSRYKNSYAPKDILDWMLTVEKGRGDFDWGIATHPYPIGTYSSKPTIEDPIRDELSGYMPVTGDVDSSPWITAANLELYQVYLERPRNRYNGQIRDVLLSESCIGVTDRSKTTESGYKQSINEQAASLAMYYYRAANMSCIKTMAYFRVTDTDSTILTFGLRERTGVKRPSFDVWKYIDTERTFSIANKYLQYIAPGASSYQEAMNVCPSDFDWNVKWDDNNIIKRTVGGGSGPVERTITTDKDSYSSDEQIIVTATGEDLDMVGLYYADDTDAKEPIYSYPISGKRDTVTFASGGSYDILAYGRIDSSRYDDAVLKTGTYKVVVRDSGGETQCSKNISITKGSNLGRTSSYLATNKTTYERGEEIIVTGGISGSDAWVGLYPSDVSPGSQTSMFWYYVNERDKGHLSGKPEILQDNAGSSSVGTKLSPGSYKVILFGDGGYSSIRETRYFEVGGSTATAAPPESVAYKLSSDTDGFANGEVTVTKGENCDAEECVLYWADENGKPLEGYTAIIKFKLTGNITKKDMYDRTIIPEGARQLLAYGCTDGNLSDEPAAAELPEGADYVFDDSHLRKELQIISDVHVTLPDEANGEVRYSNQHFSMMLNDIKANSPDSMGIFINGDMANTGKEGEYQVIESLYNEANADGSLPLIHMAIGNHDWMKNNMRDEYHQDLFQTYVKKFNTRLRKTPENVWYSEVVDGYPFIFLGGEQPGLAAVLSEEQLDWFDAEMKKFTEKYPDKPVFVFIHQPMYDTVAGSLPGQGWDGVANEKALKKILRKYPDIIMLNGHTHWDLTSESCMFPGNEDSPTAFNTASVGYLWSSYNFTTGEYIPGTHGYYVRIYDDKVVFLGRDFEKNEFIPSAIFVAQKNTIDLPSDEITTTTDADAINIDAEIGGGKEPVFTSSDYKIASVTDEGTIIPKKAGDVKITVTAPGTSTTTVNRKIVNVHIEEGIDEFTDWEFNENSKTHSRRNVDTGVVQYKACNTDDHKVEKAATTSEDGVFNCYCSVCGGRQSNEVIRKIGEITAYDVMYTGRETSPKVRVLDADGKTIPAEYYTVEKAGKAIGKYKVKITFKDWYSGEVTKTVKVVPKGTSISSVKSSSKKAMTVKWKKQTSQTTGYQIQYSTTKDFSSGNKTITIKKNKTTSRTIKKLKSGKTYYVRVRTYKTKSGSKYYSEWSSAKSVKVK